MGAILELLKNRVIEAAVVAVVAAAAGLLYAFWGDIEQWTTLKTKSFIVETVVDELNKDQKSRLDEPLQKTIARLRSGEIGALSLGNFALTPSNPQYVLPIYLPKDHEGQLSVMLSGNVVPNRNYVVLMLPNGEKIDFTNSETTINLEQLAQMGRIASSGIPEGLIVRPQYMEGFRTLTFQLVSSAVDSSSSAVATAKDTERVIHVSYLALIRPAISLGTKP